MENEKRQLLNALSDAIKECQLRFGGKRELATEIDGRVCFLCLKLESIFMHGIKNRYLNLSNSSLNPASILTNTLQLNSIMSLKQKNLFKNPGNLISNFFDDNRSQYKKNDLTNFQEQTFWPFIKNFMNKFDIERYEILSNVNTNTGRQRAWLRSCLNEHCLERFTLAILANEHLLNQYYEEWSFLNDKSYNSTLPMLISGLESILFAINIDNANLNIQNKLNKPATLNQNIESLPIEIQPNKNSESNQINTINSFNEKFLELEKNPNLKVAVSFNNLNATNSRKIRKNNVVVLDAHEINSSKTAESFKNEKTKNKKELRSKSVFTSSRNNNQKEFKILTNPINFSVKKDTISETEYKKLINDNNFQNNNQDDDRVFDNFVNNDRNSVQNEIVNIENREKLNSNENSNYQNLTDELKESLDDSKIKLNFNNMNSSDTSGDSSIEKNYDFKFDSNLVTLNPSLNSIMDNISINSYLSENSNEVFLSKKINDLNQHSPPLVLECKNDLKENKENLNDSSNKNLNMNKILSLSYSDTRSNEAIGDDGCKKNLFNLESAYKVNDYDGISFKELREFVLTLIQRKDDLENKYQILEENYFDEKNKNLGLNEKLLKQTQTNKSLLDNLQIKLENLESENKLLKDQLKKYVSAVQMMRTNNNNSISNQDNVVSIPAEKQSLKRDFSYEAEQYEKKLIQVAEMHGELMEFNSRLHKILNNKTFQVEKLTKELVELRGPLPNELITINDETASTISDISNININGPLINIWIPSVFLRTNKNDCHHVYQVYVRIRDEEWNIYRRFSHFYSLNKKLKEKYPIISTITFPKKKAIGNKDAEFVEERRKMLQDYLRQVVNKISHLDRDFNAKPCRETLIKSLPFLSDQFFNPIETNFTNSANGNLSNSLGHVVRNNTVSSYMFLDGSENLSNSPILNNLNMEPLYTGL